MRRKASSSSSFVVTPTRTFSASASSTAASRFPASRMSAISSAFFKVIMDLFEDTGRAWRAVDSMDVDMLLLEVAEERFGALVVLLDAHADDGGRVERAAVERARADRAVAERDARQVLDEKRTVADATDLP